MAEWYSWGIPIFCCRAVTLIEFQDKATLEQMRQNPELAPHLTPFPVGERALAIIAKGKLKIVKQALTQLGVRVNNKLTI